MLSRVPTRAKAAALAVAVVASGLAVTSWVSAAPSTYEAESAALSGGARSESDHPGYSGSGYVGGFVDANRGGASVTFAVGGASAGGNEVAVRYANGTGSTRTVSLVVNGTTRQISLPATANWGTWATARHTVTLAGGANTIAVRYGTADNGNVNLDNIAVAPVPAGAGEAEAAQLSGGARVESEHAGHTGSGYVGGFVDANRGSAAVTFAVSSAAARTAGATIRYANGTGSARTMSLIVNGTTRQVSLPATTGWASWGTVTEQVALNAGANTVALKYGPADSGNVNVDNLAVAPGSPTTTTTTTTPPPDPSGATVELETAFLAGGAGSATDAGVGYATGLTQGARVIRTVNRPTAGQAAVTLRYRNNTGGSRTLSAYANGLRHERITLPAGDWRTLSHTLPLRSGVNLVGYQVDSGDTGGVHLDSVTVAGSVALDARGATLPYSTHEAETATTTGTVLAAGRTYTTVQAEASGRRAVQLSGTGRHVQITLTKPANAVTVRASIPDSADGTGTSAPLAVYADGTKVRDLTLTSKYSWMYGPYPFTAAPGGERPHRYFDDSRALLPRTYPAGTVLRFAKDTAATAHITVDLIETELVDAPYGAPAGYVNVNAHGAVANDGGDDTNAIRAAISAAQGGPVKGVWLPAGNYNINGLVNVAGVDVRGAGMWHTVLHGANRRGGFMVQGSNTQLGDFTFDGDVTTRDPDSAPNSDAAFEGDFGTGSLLRHLASNHAKVGLWVGGSTNGLYAVGLRLRNTMADGVNVNGTAANVRVEQSTLRNTGDDALAMWSWNGAGWHVRDTVFAFNTVSLPILANGAAIYGGTDNRVEDNLITDTVFQGSGVTVSSWHDARPFGGTTLVRRNTLTRAGTHSLDWGSDIGALWIYAPSAPINAPVVLRDMDVIDSTHQGLLLSWQQTVSDLTLDRVSFNGTGTIGMEFNTPGRGTFSHVTVQGNRGPALVNNSGFVIQRGPGNIGF
ncbi:carbohydrate-binding protein [Actinokineospora sp. 24-640]